MRALERDPDALLRGLVVLAERLCDAGVARAPLRVADAAAAIAALDEPGEADVYWALRCTLTSGPEDAAILDLVYGRPLGLPRPAPDDVARVGAHGASGDGGDAGDGLNVTLSWSDRERLADIDLAAPSPAELRDARRLMARLLREMPLRTSRRRRPVPAGDEIDMRRTLRAAARSGGVPLRRAYHGPSVVPRRWLAVLDVSGSMAAHSRGMLLFLHALVGAGERVEAFAFGTRLTRLTHELRDRRPEVALGAAAGAVPDAAGGTRIGDALGELVARWGTYARGAVVVIVSDGWDRGDPARLAAAMERLRRHARVVIWANPLAGVPGYRPLAGGMAAALPHVDRLIPAATLADLAALPRVVAEAERSRTSPRGRGRLTEDASQPRGGEVQQ